MAKTSLSPGEALTERSGLPEPLRALVERYPRGTWQGHENFGGLVAFWLDRHVMFRRLLEALQNDAEAVIGGTLDPQQHKGRLQRYGSMLVGQLHGHHQIEDMHYFPQLTGLEPRLQHGFDLLDADHHALDGLLAGFTDGANAVLQGGPPGVFHEKLVSFERLLNRHLTDEEDLIVPVILKHGPDHLA